MRIRIDNAVGDFEMVLIPEDMTEAFRLGELFNEFSDKTGIGMMGEGILHIPIKKIAKENGATK